MAQLCTVVPLPFKSTALPSQFLLRGKFLSLLARGVPGPKAGRWEEVNDRHSADSLSAA